MPLWTPPRPHPDIPGTKDKVLTPANKLFHRYDRPEVWGALADQRLHNPFRDFDFSERGEQVPHGWDAAEEAEPDVVKRFHDRYAHHLAKAQPTITVPTSAIAPIVKSGRLQSQFETNRSRGVMATDERAFVEHAQHGYPEDLPGHARPIYGTLSLHPHTDTSTRTYGEHTLVLHKPHIWHRTTFSGGDSMSMFQHITPSPVAEPARHAVPLDHFGLSADTARAFPTRMHRWLSNSDPEDLADMFWRRGDREGEFQYPEAQYHGGVGLHAVRYAVLRSPGSRMHPEVREASRHLTSAGIPWVHTGGYRQPTGEDERSGYAKGVTPLPPKLEAKTMEGRAVETSQKLSAGPHAPNVTWQRQGGEAYLLGLSEPGHGGVAMGQVADVVWRELHPPMPVASILARGYWHPVEHDVSSADVMALIK